MRICLKQAFGSDHHVCNCGACKIEQRYPRVTPELRMNREAQKRAAAQRTRQLAQQGGLGGAMPRPAKPGTLRYEVFARDDFRCKACGTEASLTIDHIVPLSKGGSKGPRNLQTLCAPCNRAKGDSLPPPGTGEYRHDFGELLEATA